MESKMKRNQLVALLLFLATFLLLPPHVFYMIVTLSTLPLVTGESTSPRPLQSEYAVPLASDQARDRHMTQA